MQILALQEPRTAPAHRIDRGHDALTETDITGGRSFAKLTPAEDAALHAAHGLHHVSRQQLLAEVERHIAVTAVDLYRAGRSRRQSLNLASVPAIARAALDELIDGKRNDKRRADACEVTESAFYAGDTKALYMAALDYLNDSARRAGRKLKEAI